MKNYALLLSFCVGLVSYSGITWSCDPDPKISQNKQAKPDEVKDKKDKPVDSTVQKAADTTE